jgi:hypothetical protein
MVTSIAVPPRPRPLPTILVGGLLAGLLDHIDATIQFTLMMGISPGRMFHYIASGLIGMRASMQLGWLGAVLGAVLHFTIAVGAAAVYYLAALRLPVLLRRPFLSGTIFGLGLYLFMSYLIGIPIALIAKRSVHTS